MDCHYINLEEIAGSSSNALQCINTLKKIYKNFMKIHTVLAAHSQEFPYVDEKVFRIFVEKANIVNNIFKVNHAIALFKEIAIEEKNLNRPQFLKIMILIAQYRYQYQGKIYDPTGEMKQ